MNYLNTCIVEGNLTDNAESRTVGSSMITTFSMAQNRNYINSRNELVRETTFFNTEVWGEGFANKTSKFLTKGTPVRVQGRIKIDTWNDESGKKREKMVIVCEKFDFLPSSSFDKNKNNQSGDEYNFESESINNVEIVEEKNGSKAVKTKNK